MTRLCSGIRCPMNAYTCKCTGMEGCEYYTPAFTMQEIAYMLRTLADALEADCKRMPLEAQKARTGIIKE